MPPKRERPDDQIAELMEKIKDHEETIQQLDQTCQQEIKLRERAERKYRELCKFFNEINRQCVQKDNEIKKLRRQLNGEDPPTEAVETDNDEDDEDSE